MATMTGVGTGAAPKPWYRALYVQVLFAIVVYGVGATMKPLIRRPPPPRDPHPDMVDDVVRPRAREGRAGCFASWAPENRARRAEDLCIQRATRNHIAGP